MNLRRTRSSFDQPRPLLIFLTITLLTLGLSLGLTSLQTSTKAATAQNRTVRVNSATVCAGGNVDVTITLDAQGNENAVGFTLSFDTAILNVVSVTPGSDASGATFNSTPGSGTIGVNLALPTGQTFGNGAAGSYQIATISFTSLPTAPSGPTQLVFDTTGQVLDTSANPLSTDFNSGTVNVRRPSLVTGLLPNTVNAGYPTPLLIRVTGVDFAPGSRVALRIPPNSDRPLNVQSLSPTVISAFILPEDLVVGASAQIVVTSPGPCSSQSVRDFTIINPAPVIGAVTPNLTNVGSAVDITVTGTNFVLSSKVLINNLPLVTTYSGGKLIANVPTDKVSKAGVANITVFTPVPGGGTSSGLPFTINNLVPGLTSLNPSARIATGPGFNLTVTGTNFVSDSKVRFNGADRPTTFVSATQLTAAISAADIATAGTPNITVFSPAPGGGTSNALTLTVTPAPLAPTITSLSPGNAIAGGQQFTLTVNGANYAANSVVRVNNSDRATTFVNANQLTATIPATDIATQGRVNITVFTPPPGGGTSNTVPLFVGAQFSSVSAASYLGGELADTSIIAGFGLNLANGVGFGTDTDPNTPDVQLPTTLAGANVVVRDSAGTIRPAPLFFASPQQLNYLMPPGTANGPADIEVTNGVCPNCKISVGGTQISRVAPGIFSATSDGKGIAAAVILRVKPGNVQTFERMVQLDTQQGKFVTVPVDVGPAADNVFLVLFGTGFRFFTMLPSVSVTIGGMSSQVSFAGAQGPLLGLDQCNILIPKALATRGDVDVVLTVNGKVTNTLKMNIK